jgi:YHS domain-containing protein
MVRYLYFIIVALLVRYVWKLIGQWTAEELRRRVGEARAHRGESEPRTLYKGVMVRDPVCGLHVPESRALTEQRSGETIYFCSETCRQSFLADASRGSSRARA